jgi:transposase-like protein
MPDIDLPRLSGAELAALFGDDVAALQRYRMLAALLREGRPTAEVARAFGVSRESLRRLRRAFAKGDLTALRTRRRGGGHFARSSLLARALRDELGADPGAPASALWQRVAARMAEQGARAPRSTFYRLLARLRDDEQGEGGGRSAAHLLREALDGLLEDPPLALGRSQLAQLLLAEERDPIPRGRRLAAALNGAIERMRPGDAPDLDDPRWRPHRILAGEYLEGIDRADLQATLALSASTYSRAKREQRDAALEALVPVEALVTALHEHAPYEERK